VASYLVILSLTHARNFARGYRERHLQAARLEAELTSAELQLLTMQLQPAFLFTTLDAIAAFARSDPARADRMIVRLGDLLRLMLQEGGHEYTLGRELDFIQAYLAIQRTRFDGRLEVAIDAEPDALDARVPRLVLHSLVESLLDQGPDTDAERRRVEIQASRATDQLVLRVRAAPLDGARPQPIRQAAVLRAARARLEQHFGAHFRLDVDSARDGAVRLTLVLPFDTTGVDDVAARVAS
jgi:LytS/YehU family sensor histidine kinase